MSKDSILKTQKVITFTINGDIAIYWNKDNYFY